MTNVAQVPDTVPGTWYLVLQCRTRTVDFSLSVHSETDYKYKYWTVLSRVQFNLCYRNIHGTSAVPVTCTVLYCMLQFSIFVQVQVYKYCTVQATCTRTSIPVFLVSSHQFRHFFAVHSTVEKGNRKYFLWNLSLWTQRIELSEAWLLVCLQQQFNHITYTSIVVILHHQQNMEAFYFADTIGT